MAVPHRGSLRPVIPAAALLAALAACAGDEARAVPQRPASAQEAATLAATTAVDTAAILQDVSAFIGDGFAGSLGGGAGLALVPRFLPPTGCSAQLSFDLTHVALASECTLPSGRHVAGTLRIALGGQCGLGGLTVDFDLLVESQPGAGDELHVKGHVGLAHGGGELWLATSLEKTASLGAHDVTALVGACVVLDLPERRLAMDGAVSLDVDGARLALFRVSDLQHLLCDTLPYTGTIRAEHDGHAVEVVFDRDTPSTGVVTVTTDLGTTKVELPLPLAQLCAGGQVPAPAVIDYATCGGCGHPAPPPASPADPIMPPPPVP
jgi:hypothetical protein